MRLRLSHAWLIGALGVAALGAVPVLAQLVDKTTAPNAANEGINKSYAQQAGAGRGNDMTVDSSAYIIQRDPFRSIRRGRQIFQRKFTRANGQGPVTGDGAGNPGAVPIIGAGLADSCAACHGRPRGSAGFGGDVVTRPDSRDAPHLFGLGLKEMLADEITTDLRAIRKAAVDEARRTRRNVTRALVGKGIRYGQITARPNGTVDTSRVEGVDADLRVRPFFLHGETMSIREFAAGAFNAEMGLEVADPDLHTATNGGRIVTPAGMVLDGSQDKIEAPVTHDPDADPDEDGVTNEVPESILDHMEFYLLHYFKPGTGEQNSITREGRALMVRIGCTSCHVPDLTINKDRRVADVETVFDPTRGNPYNRIFATATPLFNEVNDGSGHPTKKVAKGGSFVVRNIFTDFKRHDLGPNFHEINFDNTMRRQFLTTPLWGVGDTAPYGHDGRTMTLEEVIRRHGGEAQASRDRFVHLSFWERQAIVFFLRSLILFPPDDTPSNLDPGNPAMAGYPQFGHGSIRLPVLFNTPTDLE